MPQFCIQNQSTCCADFDPRHAARVCPFTLQLRYGEISEPISLLYSSFGGLQVQAGRLGDSQQQTPVSTPISAGNAATTLPAKSNPHTDVSSIEAKAGSVRGAQLCKAAALHWKALQLVEVWLMAPWGITLASGTLLTHSVGLECLHSAMLLHSQKPFCQKNTKIYTKSSQNGKQTSTASLK